MNKETTKLLEALSQKLGTTTEYLWKALVAQAPVNSINNIIESLVWIILGFGLYKLHRRFVKLEVYDDPDIIGPVMLVLGIVWVVGTMVIVGSIGETITGFVNPEYWALKEILDSVK